ncbi:RagB/SusD family nutrient uptake outer membrane protein [Pedobacter nutrimenti]|uniref:RagB/SusD family nutrient uptake outer membrane protein n=1 Tax=Pedobacter nutrimenti TaxID=1241337 RepID=UPI00292CD9BE|nr:RagB/SusD family nutrient uptake outer membrane protein [Pedobacter nutrimenti]
MKISNINYIFLLLCAGMISLSACKKNFLSVNNPAAISDQDVYKDASLLRLLVNGIYNDRPGWDYNTYNNITDEARSNYPGGPNSILVGNWDAVNNPMGVYETSYVSIRKMNEFFSKIPASTIDAATKTELSAEVYFLRAFAYLDLVKRYGGVPLIDKPQALTDDLFIPRSTIDQTFSFILADLEKAIADLPAAAPRGMATKGAAMALKGRVLLYAASPLYASSNSTASWAAAAAANKAVMDLGTYQLFPDLTKLWLNTPNKESIFEIDYSIPQKQTGLDAKVKPVILANNDAGQLSPTQDLVNAFPMANGKAITDPTSGYDPGNPYIGRDSRFYAYIAYNGTMMTGTTSGPPLKTITLQIYDGGRDFNGDPALQIYNTITGYYCIKAINPNNTVYTYGSGSDQPFMDIRYAEVLLNYAEAQNEASGPDQSVYNAINLVRSRAGITQPVTGLNQVQVRNLIINERFVEFCFEDKRYWDLRRWKLAATVINNRKALGAFITKNANNTFSYQYVSVDPQNMVFLDKMYFMPIPFSELTKNKNLVQNPGWQ